MQIAAGGVLKLQTHQINHPVPGFLEVGAQKLVAEIARNLHHALGRIGADGVEFVLVDETVLHAVSQGFFKKRAGVKQRNA